MGIIIDIKKTSIYQDGKEDGKIEGKIETSLDIAQKMIKEGIDLNLIAKITGLSLDELKKLKNIN